MALVPYRVSGPAADQRAAERLLQLPGGITLHLTQWPALSGAAAAPGPAGPSGAAAAAATAIERASGHYQQQQQQQQQQRPGPQLDNLANVGLVVWQAGFLLADFLLHEAPEGAPALGPRRGVGVDGGGGGDWRSLTVVDLGTGSGVVGIALALAGARVFLTDLPHVVPLAAANVAANCDPRVHRACVCAYRWGDDPATAAAAEPSPLEGVEPDVITAADVLYHEELLPPLMAALRQLSAPHTVSYVSYRVRQGGEVAAFLALAEAAGFAAEEVPDAALHVEYRRRGGSGGGGRAGGGGGVVGMEIGDGMDDSDEDGVWQPGVAGECAADRERRPPGSYGILRLCRRDCANPPPPASAAAAAADTGVSSAPLWSCGLAGRSRKS